MDYKNNAANLAHQENLVKIPVQTFRHYQESIEQNFDVSVVMPFYKKLEAFKRVLPRNRKYFEPLSVIKKNG